ncbi:WhiB family transcriptional regulator [Streptomyces tubercidicus]|uniref:WhiB family transcriptional regulator n=1 Tax=Streptomyces tubercidicus TaxID=47759 RepID=UPI0036C4D142
MRHECLIFALINHEGSGVWGGMHLYDRMHLKRNVPRSEWRWHPPTTKSEEQDEEVPGSLAA